MDRWNWQTTGSSINCICYPLLVKWRDMNACQQIQRQQNMSMCCPKLAQVEDDREIDGLLVLLNTVGGDVESGLAIAEMIASLSKPVVSLVLGGSHSIGVPLAVAADYSFIVPTGTMVIHPVRMSGTVIGAPQTYDYFQQMQDRITGFIASHSQTNRERMEELMLNTGMLTKDLGTILVGHQAVEEGIINEVGGISDAVQRLHFMINESSI